MRRNAYVWALALMCCLCAVVAYGSASSASYIMRVDVVDAAGSTVTSSSYRLLATAGENDVGTMTSPSYLLRGGFLSQVVGLNSQNLSLTVQSLYGTAQPSVGTYTNLVGTVLTNRVAAPPDTGTTQYVCTGWFMTGHAPASGSTTSMVMTVTNNAVLTWLWQTNFWRDTAVGLHGAVSVTDGWQTAGSTTQILAIADLYYRFTNWSGSVSGGDVYANPLTLVMSGPKAVTGCFAAITTTNGTPHWWLAQYGLATNEVGATYDDGDGHPAWKEYIAGTNPTNLHSVLKITGWQVSGASNRVVLQWSSVTGRVYSIEYATNLLAAGYYALTSGLSATPMVNTCTGAIPGASHQWFYRVTVTNGP